MKSGQTPSLVLKAKSTDVYSLFDSGASGVFIEDVDFDSDVSGNVTYKVAWKSKPGFTLTDGGT